MKKLLEVNVEERIELPILFKDLPRNNKYVPTVQGFDRFINEQHLFYSTVPVENARIKMPISGWLRPADALKLYEMAYYSEGDILELGTNRGLSAYVMAAALRDSGLSSKIHTVELLGQIQRLAAANIARYDLTNWVEFHEGDGATVCQKLIDEGKMFDFAFVDHSHAYEHVLSSCQALKHMLRTGSFALFHDFTDGRNTDTKGVGESETEYGIFAAIKDAFSDGSFSFYGVCGCCGLFRREN